MLIRDTDDERRARVEALVCELLRPREKSAEHLETICAGTSASRGKTSRADTLERMLNESPKPGDLYVKRSTDTSVVFLIGPERHYAQVTYGAYDEAIDHARRAGSRFNVDVWMTLDGVTFESIARYRP
jgi:hypothetical protein